MATNLGLPEGFVLDKPQGSQLPEGFVLDEPQKSNLLTDPVETLKRSGGEFLGGIGEAVSHPIQTTKALGNLAIGVGQKLIPGEQDKEKFADSLGQFYIDRYGSIEDAKKTILEDPVGFASDLSIFLTGGGAITSKVGQVSKLGKVAKAGQVISKAGRAVDPLVATTRGAGKLIKAATKGKKIAPFAKSVDNPVVKAAENLGVDLPASSKSTSRVVPLVESLTAKGFFGEKLSAKVARASERLVEIGDEIIQKTGASDDLGKAGQAVLEGANKFRDRFFRIKEALYEKADFANRGKNISVNAQESVSLLDDLIAKKSSAGKILPESQVAGLKSLKKIRDNLKGGKVTAVDVKNALEELNQTLFNSTDPVVTGNRAQLRKLSATLGDELDNAVLKIDPSLSNDLQRANKFFKLSLEEINSHFGKQIFKYADQPDKILPAILKNTTSVDDVKRIYRLIGKDNVVNVQSAFMREMFEGAKNAQTGLFTPQGVSRQLKKFGKDKIGKVLTPEQVNTIEEIGQLSASLGKFEKVAQGSQTAFTARIAALVAAGFNVEPMTAIAMLGGDAALSTFVSSQKGQRLLTKGIDLTAFGERVGGRVIRSGTLIGRAGRTLRVGSIVSDDEN